MITLRSLWAFGLLLAFVGSASAENLRLLVYHTNDIHGWVMSRPAAFNQADPKRLVGGFPALARVIAQEPGPRLLLDGGDWFQGTPEGSVRRGKALVPLFNAAGYDALVVGNHDFDNGASELRSLIRGLKMPVLAANVYDRASGKRVPWLKPWFVKKVGGVKVGIFGLLTTRMGRLSFPEHIAGLEFKREADEAKKAVKALKKAGATVIIAVTHLGFEAPQYGAFEGDQTIAREAPEIDLIVGGHTHTRLTEPARVGRTLIVQAGTGLSSVGKVVLELDGKTKTVVSSRGELKTLWIDEAGEDERLLSLVKAEQEEVSKAFDVVVGTAGEALGRNPGGESAMGDWMADCARSFGETDAALINGGGIRSDIPAGPVTLRTLYNVMPFDNYAVKLTLTGRELSEAFDHGAAMNKEMVQASGVSFKYARHAPPGRRLSDVAVLGRPLDPSATYTLETVDFLIRGGDGYNVLAQARKEENSRTLLRDVLRGCVEKTGAIKPPPGGRMTPMEEPLGTQERAR